MKHCTQCGHVLGLGRFCTNCGHPVAARHADPLSDPIDVASAGGAGRPPTEVDLAGPAAEEWRQDTAERVPSQAVPPRDDTSPSAATPPIAPPAPRVPPAVVEPPPPPRFPLFADEVEDGPGVAEPVTPQPSGAAFEPVPAAPSAGAQDAADYDDEDWDEDWDDWEDRRRPRVVRVVGALVVLAALVGGAWFLGQVLSGDDSADDPVAGSSDPGQEPVDRTADASAEAPRTAPPTKDVDGKPTSYDASNMLDGVPETAWRVAGAGTGVKLVFTFPEKTRISEVGLINGYAKTATDAAGKTFDWYAGHRRITQVTWNFGVGSVVRQDLGDDRAMQTIDVGPVETRKVVLKIVATTPPGQGPTRRNFTAISDVYLAG